MSTLNILNIQDLVRAHARAIGKPILYLACVYPYDIDPFPIFARNGKDYLLAAPYLELPESLDNDRSMYIVCDSEEHMYELYDLTYGGDGLTRQEVERSERG